MTRETKSYELKIYDQSLMRFEAAYDAFGSLKLEITDIDSANAHLLPLNLIVDQDEKSLASWMEGRTIPKNRAFVEQILSTAGLTRNDILGILDVSKGLSINDSYWLDDGKSDVTFDGINLFDNRFDEVLGLVAYTGYTPSQKHKAGVSSEWTLGGRSQLMIPPFRRYCKSSRSSPLPPEMRVRLLFRRYRKSSSSSPRRPGDQYADQFRRHRKSSRNAERTTKRSTFRLLLKVPEVLSPHATIYMRFVIVT